MINLESENTQEILNQISYLTNNLVFKVNKTAEELKDSELMEDLDLCWIRICSSNNYKTDMRNEETAKVGRKLTAIPFVKDKLKRPNNPKMQKVAEKMSQEHRFIQQSFSKLVFCHFALCCTAKENKILCDTLGEDFYRLPLI